MKYEKRQDLTSPKAQTAKNDKAKSKEASISKKDKRFKTDDEHNIQSDLLSDTESEKSPDKRKEIYGNGPPKKKRANFTMIIKPDCMS